MNGKNNEKIDSLLKKMTLEEKASFCSGKDMWYLEGLERLDIPSIMVTDGPHGLRKQKGESDHIGLSESVPATCFPTASGLASSWNRDLLFRIGEALGDECRQEKVSVLLGPGVNIKRNPLCGRNFEYFSEDPFLSGEMAAALIKGVQSKGVGTSLKHFAANNQEHFRMTIDTIVDERTLREIYLAGFEKAVKEAQPWTVMNAYNKLNGEFCSENKGLLTGILKEEWGHEGLVVTDWGACNDRVEGLKAGQELEMPGNGGINDAGIIEAVRSGKLDETVLDKRVKRILELIFKTAGVLNEDFSYNEDEHHRLAVEAAAESMVLLKNESGRLPLKRRGTVAVLGDFAVNPRYQGAGSSQMTPTRLDSALEAIKDLSEGDFSVEYARGYIADSDRTDGKLIEEAVSLAERADQTVLFVGLPPSFESEGFDRTHMSLPENQLALIDTILEKAPHTVIVLSNGSPVEMPFADRCDAVLESYLSGQGGGTAAAQVLFGEAVPSGKLAETFPRKLSDVPSYNYFPGSMKQVIYREGLYVGYRYFDKAGKKVLFPFGHGLSYTDFSYSGLKLSAPEIKDGEKLTVKCTIKNTGSAAGKETVQLYVRDVYSTVYRPDKELKGFVKIALDPGEAKEVSFELDRRSFTFYDATSHDWQIEGGEFRILIGASAEDIRLEESLTVLSDYLSEESEADRIYKAIVPSIHHIGNDEYTKLLGSAIPTETPLRPFNTNSTVSDISRTLIGKLVKREIIRSMAASFGEIDENTKLMVMSFVREMPLRSLVTMGGGRFSPSMLEGLIHILNRRFLKALKAFLS